MSSFSVWPRLARTAAALLACAWLAPAHAADVRERTRPLEVTATGLTQAQASDITLTLTEVALRPIQSWIRGAGTLDASRHTVTLPLDDRDAQSIRLGQRVRGFAVNGRTRMNQGRVTAIHRQAHGALVEATLSGDLARADTARYLLEILTEEGPHLSVPNVSIIDEGTERVAYLQSASGELVRRVITTGLEGELYTQVEAGLEEGDRVVSIGSFFVDAEHKLSAAGAAAMLGICTTTPGMDFASLQSSGQSRKSRLAEYRSQVSDIVGRGK